MGALLPTELGPGSRISPHRDGEPPMANRDRTAVGVLLGRYCWAVQEEGPAQQLSDVLGDSDEE